MEDENTMQCVKNVRDFLFSEKTNLVNFVPTLKKFRSCFAPLRYFEKRWS